MRVLHIQDHTLPQMSGYAYRSWYLVAAQLEAGIRAEVLSSARHRHFASLEERHQGVRMHRTPWPQGAWQRLQLRLPLWRERVLTDALRRRTVEVSGQDPPDLLHAHSPIFNGLAALKAGTQLGLPVVYEIRAFWEDDAVDKGKIAEGSPLYRLVRRIETRICQRAAHVVVICEGLARDLVGRGIARERVLVVRNGVDGERFRPTPRDQDLARRLGLEGRTVAGFVGSFFHYEGLPLLVEAGALLRSRHPDLRILLVGGGEDEDRVRQRVRELGADAEVILAGRVPHDQTAAYYGLMDLLVYPRLSRRLTELVTPLKPLEALAMEKSVIGSDVGGLRELLQGCGQDRFFPAGSAEGLARAISDWLTTPREARREEEIRGRERAVRRHDWGVAGRCLLELYRGLTRDQPPKPLPDKEKRCHSS